MKYFGVPKWRWVLFVPISFLVLPLGAMTILTAGAFRGIVLWGDLLDWAQYEDKRP